MKLFGIGKFELLFTAILVGSIMLLVYISVLKEKKQMSIRSGIVGGFSVEVESPEDLYNALDGMHTQSMENLGENHEVTIWLADKLDEMYDKFDLDEVDLFTP